MCHQLDARVLIDDSAENVLLCATQANPPVPCLLFGSYAWNAAIREPGSHRHPDDKEVEEGGMTYKQKEEKDPALIRQAEERRREVVSKAWLPEGVERVRDWDEVVRWVKERLA